MFDKITKIRTFGFYRRAFKRKRGTFLGYRTEHSSGAQLTSLDICSGYPKEALQAYAKGRQTVFEVKR